MKSILSLIFISIFLICSCSDDNSTNSPAPLTNDLNALTQYDNLSFSLGGAVSSSTGEPITLGISSKQFSASIINDLVQISSEYYAADIHITLGMKLPKRLGSGTTNKASVLCYPQGAASFSMSPTLMYYNTTFYSDTLIAGTFSFSGKATNGANLDVSNGVFRIKMK